jgi:hypothetical protein
MSSKIEVCDDTTDPGGTLRPNLPPEPTVGTHFTPLQCPDFEHRINLPASVDRHSPIAIFDLFFTPEQMLFLAENTNKSGPYWSKIGPRNRQALAWADTTVEELYAYLGILIYMGLHVENDIHQYWCVDSGNQPSHGPVRTAMARERWKQISRAFHISEEGQSAFAKVKAIPVSLLCNLLTNSTGRAS